MRGSRESPVPRRGSPDGAAPLCQVRPESAVRARDHRRTERSKTASQLRVEEKDHAKDEAKRQQQERERSRATSAMKVRHAGRCSRSWCTDPRYCAPQSMLQRRRSTREASMQNVIDMARQQVRDESRRRSSAHSLGNAADEGGADAGDEGGGGSGGTKGSGGARSKWRRGLASVRAGLAIGALRRRGKRGGQHGEGDTEADGGATAGAAAGGGGGFGSEGDSGGEMASRLDSDVLRSLDTASAGEITPRGRVDSGGRPSVNGEGEGEDWALPPPEEPTENSPTPNRLKRAASSRRWRMSAQAISPPPSQRLMSGDRLSSRRKGQGSGDERRPSRPGSRKSREGVAAEGGAVPAPASTGSGTSTGGGSQSTPPPSVRSLPSLDSLNQSPPVTPRTSDNVSLSPPSVRAEREESSTGTCLGRSCCQPPLP